MFSCQVCGEQFQSKHSVKRHHKDVHGVSESGSLNKCGKKGCDAVFSTEEDFKLHVRSAHDNKATILICHLCKKIFPSRLSLRQHFRKLHPGDNITASRKLQSDSQPATGVSLLKRNKELSIASDLNLQSEKLICDSFVSTHDLGAHTCPYCHVSQPSQIVLNMHVKYCQQRPNQNEIVIYVKNN